MVKKNIKTRNVYLTKRILKSVTRAAGLKASKEAMKLMGFVVVSQDGWVIKKYANGSEEKIKPIISSKNLCVVLD